MDDVASPSSQPVLGRVLAFGVALNDRIKIPLGLIDASLGATWIESWISAQSLRQFPPGIGRARYAQRQAQREKSGRRGKLRHRGTLAAFDLMVVPWSGRLSKGCYGTKGKGIGETPVITPNCFRC